MADKVHDSIEGFGLHRGSPGALCKSLKEELSAPFFIDDIVFAFKEKDGLTLNNDLEQHIDQQLADIIQQSNV
jgi:hypothetical protein